MATWVEYLKKDTLFSNAIRLQHLVWTILHYVPKGSRILETGFGSGMTSILLADLGYSVTALDIDEKSVRIVKEKFPHFTNSGKFTVLNGDMFTLPLQTKSFALVYHQGVLEHFSDQDIILALKENGRVAELVIFDVPNSRSKLQDFGD